MYLQFFTQMTLCHKSYSTHKHIEICTHIHMHACMSVYTHIHASTNACIRTYTHTYTRTCAHTHTCVYAYTLAMCNILVYRFDIGTIFITIQYINLYFEITTKHYWYLLFSDNIIVMNTHANTKHANTYTLSLLGPVRPLGAVNLPIQGILNSLVVTSTS